MPDIAKPFLKWPGGKSRLIPQLEVLFPEKFTRYVEPLTGGGAVFLHVVQTRKIKASVLCDLNEDLVLVWQTLQTDPLGVSLELNKLTDMFLGMTPSNQENFYYELREIHNRRPVSPGPARAARVIFLNKTCFNGLYRNNSTGLFNSPFGRYTNPSIYKPENIEAVSRLLATSIIIQGDFTACERFVTKGTFVYFDPPYRPLNRTSSFTAFDKWGFTDADQERLAMCFRRLDKKGARLMLSNSDTPDGYFERLYAGYNIRRVQAGRSINSNPDRRGKISELVITNY